MNKKFKFTISSLNNLPKNPATSKSTELEFTDTEVIGLKCLVGKTGNKRFLLRYVSPVTGKKASIALGRWPDIDLPEVRKKARSYKQQILEGIDPKLERENKKPESTMTLARFFEEVYLPLAKQKRTWKDDIARFRHAKPIHHIPIHELTAADIVKVQMTMQEKISKTTGKPYAVASINRVFFLMNADRYRQFGRFENFVPGELTWMLISARASAINVSESDAVGLVHFCDGIRRVDAKKIAGSHTVEKDGVMRDSFESVFNWMSYLSKVSTKQYGRGGRNFGYSLG